MPLLTHRYADAVHYALELHAAQTRKCPENVPYVGHLLRVSGLTIEYQADEDTAIAAVLHDAVEDQGGQEIADVILDKFGARVQGFVLDCSDAYGKIGQKKPAWKQRKENYIAHLKQAPPESRLISSCDKLDNMRCSVTCYRNEGDIFWNRFHSNRDDFLWYYQTIIDALETTGGTPALADLKDAYSQFIRLVNPYKE